jgi:hypothetical protein
LVEDEYGLVNNNCEHLAEWSIRDEHRSLQVEHWRRRTHRAVTLLQSVAQLLRRLRWRINASLRSDSPSAISPRTSLGMSTEATAKPAARSIVKVLTKASNPPIEGAAELFVVRQPDR